MWKGFYYHLFLSIGMSVPVPVPAWMPIYKASAQQVGCAVPVACCGGRSVRLWSTANREVSDPAAPSQQLSTDN